MQQSNFEKALNQALESAFSSLKKRDLEETAFRSGATYDKGETLRLPYLNRSVEVRVSQERISPPEEMTVCVLILHYLLRASGAALSGQMINFKEVPQGALYFQPFRNRVLLSMSGLLDKAPWGFAQAAQALEGEPMQAGDLSYRFRVFPYVTLQYVWHRGEEGIPSDLNLLFDRSISEYLSTEDIVVMCTEVNRELKSSWPKQDP